MSKERKHAAETEDTFTTACCRFLWDFFFWIFYKSWFNIWELRTI